MAFPEKEDGLSWLRRLMASLARTKTRPISSESQAQKTIEPHQTVKFDTTWEERLNCD